VFETQKYKEREKLILPVKRWREPQQGARIYWASFFWTPQCLSGYRIKEKIISNPDFKYDINTL
jgi:hypothetical protein